MLITLDDVKNYMQIDDDTQDAQILQMIVSVQAQVTKKISRNLESSEHTEYHDGDGTHILLVKEFPITAVASLHDDPERVYGDDTLISVDDYMFKDVDGGKPGAIRLEIGFFYKAMQSIKVVYTGGYTQSTVPEDIKMALIKLVGAEQIESNGAIFAIPADGEDTGGTYRPAVLRKRAWEVLKQYRSINL